MEYIIDTLQEDWASLLRFAPRLFYAGLVILAAYLAGRLAARLTTRLLQRSSRFRTSERFLVMLVVLAVNSAGLLLALGTLGLDGVVTSLLAGGGVLAVVLGFAFREIGENFLAGIFLSFSRPFELGDLIRTGDLTGTIRAIELRHVHVRTFDACDVFVPSARIFSEPLYNYTRDGLRRPSFTVGVAYDCAPGTVLELLTATAGETPDVLDTPAPYSTIKAFSEQFITYEVFFWLDLGLSSRGYVAVTNDVKQRCWATLRDAGMTFSADVTANVEIMGQTAA